MNRTCWESGFGWGGHRKAGNFLGGCGHQSLEDSAPWIWLVTWLVGVFVGCLVNFFCWLLGWFFVGCLVNIFCWLLG